MNVSETALVLAAAAAFDQRTIGETDVAAWHLVIGHLPREECVKAVAVHYATQTWRVMPANIIEGVRTARNDAHERAAMEATRLDGPKGDYRAGADAARVALGSTPAEVASRRTLLARGCPWCGAAPGTACFVAATGQPLTHRLAHPSREAS